MSGRQIIVANSTSPSSAFIAPQSESSGSLGHADAQQTSTEQRPPEPWWQPWTHDPVAIATVLLFIATCGLWFTTFKLWKTTAKIAQDTVDDAKIQVAKMEQSIAEAARAATAMEGIAEATEANSGKFLESLRLQKQYGQMQLRPYLSVLVGDGIWQDAVNQFEVRPKILNTGHTPAREVQWRLAAGTVRTADYGTFRFPLPKEKPRWRMTVAPHQEYNLTAVVPHRVTDEEASKLTLGSPDILLLVWGYLSYRDDLGRRYLTTFAQHVWWMPIKDKDGNWESIRMQGRFLYKHNDGN